MTVFLSDTRSCCGCLACRSWWRRWRLRLSVRRSTAPTTLTGPSQTTQTCGSLGGGTSTRTSSARTNTSNTTSTATYKINWVSAHRHLAVLYMWLCVCSCRVTFVLSFILILSGAAAAGDDCIGKGGCALIMGFSVECSTLNPVIICRKI